MWTLLIPILAKIPGMVGDYFKKEQEAGTAKHELRMARIHEETMLQGQIVKAELTRGTQQIKATGRFFKYFTFILWFGPFATAFVAPEYSVALFERLTFLPDWYVQSCMVIIFAIWGIASGRETIANIFRGLGTFMLRRQQNKLYMKSGMTFPSAFDSPPPNDRWKDPNERE